MISSYGDQSTTREYYIIIVLLTNAASIALNASRDTLCSIHAINIRVTHRNGAIKHIFYTNQIHGGIISRLFFIHFVAPCACSLI